VKKRDKSQRKSETSNQIRGAKGVRRKDGEKRSTDAYNKENNDDKRTKMFSFYYISQCSMYHTVVAALRFAVFDDPKSWVAGIIVQLRGAETRSSVVIVAVVHLPELHRDRELAALMVFSAKNRHINEIGGCINEGGEKKERSKLLRSEGSRCSCTRVSTGSKIILLG
jgi:hypothetical protein